MPDLISGEAGASMIEDHEYEPRNPQEPWGKCKCGLAEASHAKAAKPYKITTTNRPQPGEAR